MTDRKSMQVVFTLHTDVRNSSRFLEARWNDRPTVLRVSCWNWAQKDKLDAMQTAINELMIDLDEMGLIDEENCVLELLTCEAEEILRSDEFRLFIMGAPDALGNPNDPHTRLHYAARENGLNAAKPTDLDGCYLYGLKIKII